jgi:hypothetical protein
MAKEDLQWIRGRALEVIRPVILAMDDFELTGLRVDGVDHLWRASRPLILQGAPHASRRRRAWNGLAARIRPDANEEHVSLTAASAAFVRSEVEAGVLAVGPGAGAGGGGLAMSVGPNPFGSAVRVRFTLPRAGRAEVCVYGVDGRVVRTLAAGDYGAGAHEVVWDGAAASGARAAPGVYLVRAASGGEAVVRRVARLGR